MPYTTEKVGRTRTNVYRDGEYCCQLMNKEVAGWLHRAARSEQNDIEWEAIRRGHRLEAARAYLAIRATRATRAVQLNLF